SPACCWSPPWPPCSRPSAGDDRHRQGSTFRRENGVVAVKRILVVGAGHVGLYAALRLSKKLGRSEAEVIVVDPQPHMTYQPFLPEVSAGNISPRHSVVPLRRELPRCHVLAGHVTRIEHARRVAYVQP